MADILLHRIEKTPGPMPEIMGEDIWYRALALNLVPKVLYADLSLSRFTVLLRVFTSRTQDRIRNGVIIIGDCFRSKPTNFQRYGTAASERVKNDGRSAIMGDSD
jgi:hypothetical protein